MRRVAIVAVLAGCHAAAAPPPSAQHWIYTTIAAGLMPAPAHRTNYTLDITGAHATLTIREDHAPTAELDAVTGWQAGAPRTSTGTAQRGAAGALAVELGAMKLTCAPRSVAVHVAGAHFGPTLPRPEDYECGDAGIFTPPTTGQVDVLACTGFADDVELLFAPAPGIEHVFDDDDCVVQGGGLRLAH